MLARLLEEEIERRGISQREASRQIGVSHTTLVMVKKGRPLEVNTAYLICQWLGVPLTVAVDEVTDTDRMLSRIAAILKTAPELEQVFISAAQEVEKGTLTTEDFREIMSFAAFKIQQRRDHLANEQDRDPVPDRDNRGGSSG